jgi:hypothetical protein
MVVIDIRSLYMDEGKKMVMVDLKNPNNEEDFYQMVAVGGEMSRLRTEIGSHRTIAIWNVRMTYKTLTYDRSTRITSAEDDNDNPPSN